MESYPTPSTAKLRQIIQPTFGLLITVSYPLEGSIQMLAQLAHAPFDRILKVGCRDEFDEAGNIFNPLSTI